MEASPRSTNMAPSGKSSEQPARWRRPIRSGFPPSIRMMRRTCSTMVSGITTRARGRWTNPDPIGEKGGANIFAYVNNNCVNGYDPLRLYVVGTIDVTVIGESHDGFLSYQRSLSMFAKWTPPASWGILCRCKHCKKATWFQTIAWAGQQSQPDNDSPYGTVIAWNCDQAFNPWAATEDQSERQPTAWRMPPILSLAPEQLLGVHGLATRQVRHLMYSSERPKTRATHIQSCPGQPRKPQRGLFHRGVSCQPS